MIPSILGLAAVTLAVSLLGLLVLGARWRRRGLLWCIAYAALAVAPAYLMGEVLWRLPRLNLWVGCGLALSSILFSFFLRRDWNPAAQAFFGTLGLTCLTFVLFSAAFMFSGYVPPAVLPGGAVLVALEVFALVLLMVGSHEVLDTTGRVRWRRRTTGSERDGFTPFVSIHVPSHNEPPELVKETLRALANLDYPAYEVLVLDNNTDDEALWRPVERFCQEVGFRFVHLENWPGFKAGALNYGLRVLDPRTEIVAVVDADFIVEPDFLARTVGYFAAPAVGIVQTAQDFRWVGEAPYFRRLALTYRAFDEVTMPSRNERNAIIFAGTVGLLRRSSIAEAGGWAEWCVTEDAELSLRILARGYQSIYVERVFGRGVMPLTFAALKRQRFRWCFGGIQLLRRHWGLLVKGRAVAPDGTPLSLRPGQRYEYLAAGLLWFQPLLTLVFSALVMIGVASRALGSGIALRPLVGFFIGVPLLLLFTGVAKAVWGLRARLRAGWFDALAVFGIWLALTWAVALASVNGLLRGAGAFLRTPKFGERQSLRQAVREARAELSLALVLTATTVVAATSGPGPEATFLAVLSAWGAAVFWASPVAAFVAARADLRSETLRKRRLLESERGRVPLYRRPSSYAVVGATTLVVLLLLVSGLGLESGGGDLGGLREDFALPRRELQAPGDQAESRPERVPSDTFVEPSPVAPPTGAPPLPAPGGAPPGGQAPPGAQPSPGPPEDVAPPPGQPTQPPPPNAPPAPTPEEASSPGPPETLPTSPPTGPPRPENSPGSPTPVPTP